MGTILENDAKVTSYKLALLGAIDAVALSYPDLRAHRGDVAIPHQDQPPRHPRDALEQVVRHLERFVHVLLHVAA